MARGKAAVTIGALKLSSCRKIAVIGCSCGGKSGLCDLLSSQLELPLFSVDKHQ
jgi:uridine kinase